MKALLITNPTSGKGQQPLDRALAQLTAAGIDVDHRCPRGPDEISDQIRDRGRHADLIVLGGGDGTCNCAANALLAIGRPFGVLPMGTANDLARTLGIPSDLEEAAKVIAGGRRRRIDLGVVNGRHFFNVASIGFSSQVARFHRGERKRVLKLLSYPLSWIDAYRTHRPIRAQLTVDGIARTVRCSQLAVGNGKHYGGGLTVSTESDIDDGCLSVYYIEQAGFWALLALLPALKFGTLAKQENAAFFQGKTIELRTRRPERINIDGELVGRTPARFSVEPAALEVFVPG